MDANAAGKITPFFRFEDLRIYHKSQDYNAWVYRISNKLPPQVNNNILIRFNDAAHAIAFHIAEGSARNKNQFIYYLKMAKSSVRECLVYTACLSSVGVINKEEEDESRNYLMEMTKMIGALISSLQRGMPGSHDHDHEAEHDHDHDEFDNDFNEDEPPARPRRY
jgi:four helix bundle protein